MKYAHYIEMRVFSRQEDNEIEIINAIHELFPFDFEKEKIEFKEKKAETFEGATMKILTVFVKKERHTTHVLKNLFSRLGEGQKSLLRSQLESRLDERLHFFIRLDKPGLLKDEYSVTESGNCFHLKISIAAYPHKRTVARRIVEQMLSLSRESE